MWAHMFDLVGCPLTAAHQSCRLPLNMRRSLIGLLHGIRGPFMIFRGGHHNALKESLMALEGP